jgi:hypothetical protein
LKIALQARVPEAFTFVLVMRRPFEGSIFLNGNNVQCHSLTINGTVHPLNINYPFQQSWTLEEIDTAFQMDLDAVGNT